MRDIKTNNNHGCNKEYELNELNDTLIVTASGPHFGGI